MSQPPKIESLESRRLLSSATFYTSGSAAGHLIVRGDQNKPNTIILRVTFNGSFQVTHNGKTQTFNRAGVREFYVFGGAKDDVIRVEDLPARSFNFRLKMFGRAGNDTLTGGSFHDTIGGGDGDDLILGGYGDDQLTGDAGNDRVYGGYTKDVFLDGRDLIWGGDGDDLLVGGSWYDLMFGGAGNDRMYGGSENPDPRNRRGDASDDMFGDAGNDFMDAGAGGRNRVHGMTGLDTIVGSPGNDTLYGGAGTDNVVTGNGGSDRIRTNEEWPRLPWLLSKLQTKPPKEPNT